MGPLIPQGIIDPQWNMVIALLLGIAFGFVLESSGFSSSRKIVGLFYGYDFTVLRVFFSATVVAMLGIIYFDYLGWMDIGLLYINPLFLTSAIIGGLIMGLGFVTGGYCPGTSFCGVAIGKIDALVFTGGMFLGILLFSEAYPLIEHLYTTRDLGPVKIFETLGISQELFALIFTIIAVAAFIAVFYIERNVNKDDIVEAEAPKN